jgi:hypothetical protein
LALLKSMNGSDCRTCTSKRAFALATMSTATAGCANALTR